MAVLEEDPATPEDLGLADELLRLLTLTSAERDDVQMDGTATHFLRQAQQLRHRIRT